MTIDEAIDEAARRIDAFWEEARADADSMLREHGATDSEVAAALAHSDRLWAEDRTRQLRELQRELKAWIKSSMN